AVLLYVDLELMVLLAERLARPEKRRHLLELLQRRLEGLRLSLVGVRCVHGDLLWIGLTGFVLISLPERASFLRHQMCLFNDFMMLRWSRTPGKSRLSSPTRR